MATPADRTELAIKKELIVKFVDGLDQKWKDILFNKDMMKYISIILRKLCGKYQTKVSEHICPAPELVFNAFKLTPWESVHTVIVGQDPYFTKGTAHGLAFSTLAKKVPPSFGNIYKALINDKLMDANPKHADLTSWAKRGVLLLNVLLTTEMGKAKAHPFWQQYTVEIIKILSREKKRLVFFLWGNDAKALSTHIDGTKHLILKTVHPSPAAQANLAEPAKFHNTGHFAMATKDLKDRGITMDWTLPKVDGDIPDGVEFIGPVIFTDGGRVGHKGSSPKAGYAAYFTWHDGVGNDAASHNKVILKCHKEGVAEEFNVIYGKVPEIDDTGKAVRPTNIRGELLGAYHAFRALNENAAITGKHKFIVVTDCEYVMNTIMDWYPRRKKLGTEGELKNLDLITVIDKEKTRLEEAGHSIEFVHTRSHRDKPHSNKVMESGLREVFVWEGNEVADKFAGAGMELSDIMVRYIKKN